MSVLDLQGMEVPETRDHHKGSSRSRSCHGGSGLSLLLC